MPAYLKIITGPMFSGKSEELIRYLRRHTYAKKKVLAIKPQTDTRQDSIRARKLIDRGETATSDEFPAFELDNEADFFDLLVCHNPDVLAIDECQFFDHWIVPCVKSILRNPASHLTIYAVGLDQDAWGNPFGRWVELMAYANEVVKLTAICFACGEPANLSCKKSAGNGQIDPGDANLYEARCPACWAMPQQ